MRSFVCLVTALMAVAAVGVSRIGGGQVGSRTSLFEMKLPESYQDIEQVENLVLAHGPVIFEVNGPIQQVLQIRDYLDHFDGLSRLTRNATIAKFAANGWTRLEFSGDPCVEVFAYKNESAAGWVATWGQGRGVTIDTALTGVGEVGLQESLRGLRLLSGACAWP